MRSSLALFATLLMASDPASPVPEASRQLVLVVTPSGHATSGTLVRFERDAPGAAWKAVGSSWPIVVGAGGLGTGLGLHQAGALSGLAAKVEGDGKSPAGVFRLTSAFGFDASPSGLHIPYVDVRTGEGLECVDDPDSAHYNAIVARGEAATVDWRSSETMREIPEYRWGVVVAHNADPVRKDGGSCIFLHAFSASKGPTAGCTAMELASIEEMVRWLRSDASPVLVQLTESLYRERRESWRLPDVELH